MNRQKETAIPTEQQLEKTIINDIIKLIAKNNLTIAQANKILYETRNQIEKQVVITFQE